VVADPRFSEHGARILVFFGDAVDGHHSTARATCCLRKPYRGMSVRGPDLEDAFRLRALDQDIEQLPGVATHRKQKIITPAGLLSFRHMLARLPFLGGALVVFRENKFDRFIHFESPRDCLAEPAAAC